MVLLSVASDKQLKVFVFWANKFLMIPRKSQYPNWPKCSLRGISGAALRHLQEQWQRPGHQPGKTCLVPVSTGSQDAEGPGAGGGSQERLDMPKSGMDGERNGAWGHFPRGVALNTHSGFYFTSLIFLFLPWNKDDNDKKEKKKKRKILTVRNFSDDEIRKCPYHAWDQVPHKWRWLLSNPVRMLRNDIS